MLKKIMFSGFLAVLLHNAAQADSACSCGSAGVGCQSGHCGTCLAYCGGHQGSPSSCSCERGQATNCPVHHAPILASSVSCSSAAKEAVKSCVVPLGHAALTIVDSIAAKGCVESANIPCAISSGMAAADHTMNAIESAPSCIKATQRAIAVCR